MNRPAGVDHFLMSPGRIRTPCLALHGPFVNGPYGVWRGAFFLFGKAKRKNGGRNTQVTISER